jgi:gluconolactonase
MVSVALREVASGLQFPEGPVAMPDGSVLVVEIARGTLTRVLPDGRHDVVAEVGGGPNGAAIGPDGRCYICNNGGFEWRRGRDGRLFPGLQPASYAGGRIEVVDLDSGRVEVLYRECNGRPLRGPNDLVFDGHGGFYFTDLGKTRERERDRTGVFHARADGSHIEEILFPLEGPNGIGLSPDGTTLYVAETPTGRLWAWRLAGPGRIARPDGEPGDGRRLLPGVGGHVLYDSLAVDAAGNICVATLVRGGISVIRPDGSGADFVEMPDSMTTNICFGGPDLATAYITLSGTGRLVALPWPRPGLALHHLQR